MKTYRSYERYQSARKANAGKILALASTMTRHLRDRGVLDKPLWMSDIEYRIDDGYRLTWVARYRDNGAMTQDRRTKVRKALRVLHAEFGGRLVRGHGISGRLVLSRPSLRTDWR